MCPPFRVRQAICQRASEGSPEPHNADTGWVTLTTPDTHTEIYLNSTTRKVIFLKTGDPSMIATALKPIRKRRQTRARRCTFKNAYTRFFTRVQYGPNLYQGWFGMAMGLDPMGLAAKIDDLTKEYNEWVKSRSIDVGKELIAKMAELHKANAQVYAKSVNTIGKDVQSAVRYGVGTAKTAQLLKEQKSLGGMMADITTKGGMAISLGADVITAINWFSGEEAERFAKIQTTLTAFTNDNTFDKCQDLCDAMIAYIDSLPYGTWTKNVITGFVGGTCHNACCKY